MENKNDDQTRREERRRRILEGESDRMALITGRLPNPMPLTPQYSDDNQDASEKHHEITTDDSATTDVGRNIVMSKAERSSSGPSEPRQIRQRRPRFFSSKRLNSCIIASEKTRIRCALITALLAVLSRVDRPLFGRNIVSSESVVAARPLYILLMSDVAIVTVLMCLENQRALEEDNEEEELVSARFRGGDRSWNQAVKFMERGLVVYQAFRGVFIDISVYVVVVVCCLSLV